MRFFLAFGVFVVCAALFVFIQSTYVLVDISDIQGDIDYDSSRNSLFYFDELRGESRTFRLEGSQVMPLTFRLVVPKIEEESSFISASLYKIEGGNRSLVFLISDSASPWYERYDRFFGEWYEEGPGFEAALPGGRYEVEIENALHQGKYAVYFGDDKSVGISDLIKNASIFARMKTDFFGSRGFDYVFSYFWMIFVLFVTLAGFIFAFFLHRLVMHFYGRARRRRKQSKNLGSLDRYSRLALAVLFLVLGFIFPASYFWFLLAGFFIYEVMAHYCIFNSIISRNTYKTYMFS